MLKVDNIAVKYGNMPAVKDLSFYVNEGEIVSILGSNGAGKTTTLKSLIGVLPISGGQIHFNGVDIKDWTTSERIRSGLSLVPEGRQVFPGMTIKENMELAYFVSHPKKSNMENYNQLIESMFILFPRLKERLHQRAGSLSGGEQQMLAIARGLLTEPKLLMLDEPSLGLAPVIVDQVFEVLTKLNDEGLTIVIVEQDAHRALNVSHRGYIIESGRITFTGSSGELIENDIVQTAFMGI